MKPRAAPRRQHASREHVRRQRSVRLGAAILGLLLLFALAAPVLLTIDPSHVEPTNRDLKPTQRADVALNGPDRVPHRYWLGSDSAGRDIWSRVAYGARVPFEVGVVAGLGTLVAAVALGGLAALGRRAGAALLRVLEGIGAIPPPLLALAVVMLWGAHLGGIVAAAVLAALPRAATRVHVAGLALAAEPFVEAARLSGSSPWLLAWRHLLPHAFWPLVLLGLDAAASAIVLEATVSFLGLMPESASWGGVMAEGRAAFVRQPSMSLLLSAIAVPGLLLVATLAAIGLVAHGVRRGVQTTAATADRRVGR